MTSMRYDEYARFGWRYGGFERTADKLHDFLMNPVSRPDLQTPEAQQFLQGLEHFHNEKTDVLMPWLTREWKKGRLTFDPGRHYESTPRLRYEHREPDAWNPEQIQTVPAHLFAAGLGHWADFMRAKRHPVRRELGDIMQHDIGSFHDKVKEWDKAMQEEQERKALEGGRVVHTTPEGYTIRQLTTPEELEAEGNAMGHCVGSYANDVQNGNSLIYSLRDPKGLPHATTEITPERHVWTDSFGQQHFTDMPNYGDANYPSTQPVPHGGDVVQIQGQANNEPKPEYKAQLKHWFDTFAPEDKPKWSEDAWDYDPAVTDMRELGPEDEMPRGATDEYGLAPRPRNYDWDALFHDPVQPGPAWSEGYHEPAMTQQLYNVAKAQGKIPEMAKELDNHAEWAQDNFNLLRDQNLDNEPPYDPEGWQEEGYDSPEEYEEAYNDALREHERQLMEHAPDMQMVNQMYEHLRPHWDPQLNQYTNEGPQETFK